MQQLTRRYVPSSVRTYVSLIYFVGVFSWCKGIRLDWRIYKLLSRHGIDFRSMFHTATITKYYTCTCTIMLSHIDEIRDINPGTVLFHSMRFRGRHYYPHTWAQIYLFFKKMFLFIIPYFNFDHRACVLYLASCSGISFGGLKWYLCVQAC